jgi:nitrate reductase alpha subunit
VHELIPWRTLTGRQQLYQDHAWMRAFGEGLRVPPPVDTGSYAHMVGTRSNGNPERAELHHAAPEVGHPQHLHRQPADAHAVARRPDRVDVGGRREGDRRVDNDWIECSTPTARCARGRW